MKKNLSNARSECSIRTGLIYLALCLLFFSSCSKEEEIPEMIIPSRISFASSTYVIEKDFAGATTITLNLARPLEKAGSITIQQVTGTSTALETEYKLSPAFSAGKLTIDLPQGATTASFTVTSLHNFDDNKTVTFKLVSGRGGAVLNDTQLNTTVTMRGNTWINPAIVPSVTTLADFGSVNVNTKSAAKSYSLEGLNLTGDVTITASANFEVSKDNSTFAPSVTLNVNNKTVSVYVKFAPVTGENKAITGTITHSLAGLPNVLVSVSGTESGNLPPEVPLLNENFEYGAATEFLTRLVNPKWEAYSAEGAIPVTYVSAGLSFTGYPGSGVGGAATFEHGDFSREDVFSTFASKNSGVLYTSVLVNLSKAGDGDFFFANRDAGGAFSNRLYAKDDGTGKLMFGIGKNATVVYPANTYKYNTTYLIVTKYDFTAKVSSMFIIDAAIPAVEPGTATAASLATGTSPSNLGDVVIRQSDGIMAGTIDGIRVATTWKGVLGL